MKVLAVRGKNLTSLAQEFELDLAAAPLADAGVFAITGPTGSGKTTLLDALCLPLFDRVPRYKNARKFKLGDADQAAAGLAADDPRNILRKGAAEGFAEVEFQGIDGIRYRARWSVRRARGKADGRIQSQLIEFWDMDKQIELGDTRKTVTLPLIEEKLGLDADQFFRSVLLVQGDFSAFLKADAAQRADLLERMTGTDIYSRISQLAFEKTKQERDKRDALLQAAEHITFLMDDKREELERGIDATAKRRNTLFETCKTYEGTLAWHDQQQKLNRERIEAEQAAAASQAALQNLAQEQTQLDEWDRVQPLRAPLENRDQLTTDQGLVERHHSQAVTAGENLAVQRKAIEQDLDRTRKARDQARLDQETARPLLLRAREYDVGLDSLRRQQDQAGQALNQNAKELSAAQSRQEEQRVAEQEARQTIKETEQWLGEHEGDRRLTEGHWQATLDRYGKTLNRHRGLLLEQREAEIQYEACETKRVAAAAAIETTKNVLAEAQSAAENARSITDVLLAEEPGRQAERLREQLAAIEHAQRLERDLVNHKAKYDQLLADRDDLRAANKKIAVDRETTTLLLAEKERELAQAQQDRDQLAAARDLAERRPELLLPGKPCPLCGSSEHPAHGDALVDKALVDQLGAKVQELQKQKDHLLQQESQAQTLLTENNKKLQLLERDLEQAQESLQLSATEAASHRKQILAGSEIEAGATADLAALHSERHTAWEKAKATVKRLEQADKEARLTEERARRLLTQLDRERQAYEEVQRKANESQQALQRLSTEVDNLERERQNLESDCTPLINAERNQALLQADPKSFLAACNEAARAYHQGLQAYDAAGKRLSELEKESAAIDQQVKHHLEAQPALLRTCKELEAQVADLAAKRAAILDGRETSLVAKEHNQKVAESEQAFDQAAEKAANLEKEQLTQQVRIASLERRLAELRARAGQAEAKLGEMLQKAVLDEVRLRQVLDLSADDMNQIRERLNNTRTQRDTDRTVLQERRQREEDHQNEKPDDSDPIQTRAALQTAQITLAEVTEQAHRLKVALEQDDENRARHRAHLPEIQAQQKKLELWEELNKLIGSSDGAKFKKFAQSLTLEILLEQAGHHLRELEPRYRLERIRARTWKSKLSTNTWQTR